jgi:hypothetical protein
MRYLCGNGTITKDYYDNATSCTEFEHSSEGAANICYIDDDMMYRGIYCDIYDTFPAPGLALQRTLCPNGCDDGGECRKATFTTGVCLSHNPFQSIINGDSVIAWCYPDYVVYLGFQGTECNAPFVSSASEPVGASCFLDQNEDHIQNICN